MRHTNHAVPDAAASAVEMPTHRQPHSAVPGPASHASRRYSARPPSSGRTGSRLKAHSTPLAPAAVVHPILPRINQNYRLRSDHQLSKHDALVEKLKVWVDEQYAGGRTTALSNEELEEKIAELSGGVLKPRH